MTRQCEVSRLSNFRKKKKRINFFGIIYSPKNKIFLIGEKLHLIIQSIKSFFGVKLKRFLAVLVVGRYNVNDKEERSSVEINKERLRDFKHFWFVFYSNFFQKGKRIWCTMHDFFKVDEDLKEKLLHLEKMRRKKSFENNFDKK